MKRLTGLLAVALLAGCSSETGTITRAPTTTISPKATTSTTSSARTTAPPTTAAAPTTTQVVEVVLTHSEALVLVELMEQRVATLEEELADLRSLIEALIGEYVGPTFEDHDRRLDRILGAIQDLEWQVMDLDSRLAYLED